MIKINRIDTGGIYSEHDEQVHLLQLCDLYQFQYPELALIFAIPNGGKRSPMVGAKLKLEGVKPGVPDLFLPVPRRDKHGLFVELKRIGGRASPEQKVWFEKLIEQGFEVALCQGSAEAIADILDYLGGAKNG